MQADMEQVAFRDAPKSEEGADQARASAHAAWIYLALPLIFLSPLVVYLRHHNYDLLRPESLLCMAILVGFGLALGAVSQARPQALQYLLIALSLTVFADISWAEQQRLDLLSDLGLSSALVGPLQMLAFPLMLLVISVITALVKAKLGFIVTIMFSVILGSSLVLPQASGLYEATDATANSAPAIDRELPTVVHIVLDEQIGVEGLPRNLGSSRSLRADLTAFYLNQGFTLFGRAFSHYHMTADSIPNMLNGTAHKRRNAHLEEVGQRNRFKLAKNAWFDRLAERGYRIKVFQTDYLDFCAAGQVQAEDCLTLPTVTLKDLMAVKLGAADKSTLIFENFLQRSFVVRVAGRLVDNYASSDSPEASKGSRGFWHWRPRSLTSLSAMSLVARLQQALSVARPGTAYFAHLLLPHHAMIYDRDCRTAADLENWMNITDALLERTSIRNDAAMRAVRYERYVEQVRCTHLKLAELLDALRAAGRFEDAIIIVHGDHGSRISEREPLSSLAAVLSDDDLRDIYATHFAFRLPGQSPGYRQESRSIQALFAEYFLGRPLADENFDVYLNQPAHGSGAVLHSRPMVDFPPWSP